MGNPSYDPKKVLWSLLSDAAKDRFNTAKARMNEVEACLAEREWQGEDTSYARAALYGLDYWVSCTTELEKVNATLEHLNRVLDCKNPPSALTQDPDGSFGLGTDVWFLKLDRSTDQLLAREWPWPRRPMFLECINNPIRMVTYLQDLSWSDLVRCGRDNRKELNLAISVISRLVIKGGQAGYLSGPGFLRAFEQFVLDWQDPATGFFGETYIIDEKGNTFRTKDLSLTFHMVRYVPHLVRWWPRLIDTLLLMREEIYPQGWLNGGTDDPECEQMTDHNNYDVVEIFHRGWLQMEPRQREMASAAVKDLLDWSLKCSITNQGTLLSPDKSDPIPDAFYYAASFLDTIGYFQSRKRFWSADPVPGIPAQIRQGMIAQLRNFNPYYTEVDDTLARLGAAEHPWTNAIL
jgi:hypothetical protein